MFFVATDGRSVGAIGKYRAGVLMRVTIPVLAPAVLASTAVGLIKSLESFEIELVLGIPAGIYVVPTKVWNFIHWEPPLYDRATALCSIFSSHLIALLEADDGVGGNHCFYIRGQGYSDDHFPLDA